jgi:hypothetical protein
VRTVWKEQLNPAPVITVRAPEGAEFLHVANQYGSPCIWFRCDPSQPMRDYIIVMIGAGHRAPIDGKYLGTILIASDTLVFHFFVNED